MNKPIDNLGMWRLIAAIANERALLLEQSHTPDSRELEQGEDIDSQLNRIASETIKKLLEGLEKAPNDGA